MTTLDKHKGNQFVKMLIEGDSKTGKTGALTSLVKAGYQLRILDYDNGVDTLEQFLRNTDPVLLKRVEVRKLRDKWKAGGADGPVIDGRARAFPDGLKMLDHWRYTEDGVDIDLGVPADWGPDFILVVDSLTFFSDAAFDWRKQLIPGASTGKYDIRAVYKDAQDAVESVLALLTGENFKTNVIVISHVKYMDLPDGHKKGYPSSVGSALSPLILRYFNNVVRFCMMGNKRIVETVSSPMFDLATAAPFKMEARYEIGDALAKIFANLREPPQAPPRGPAIAKPATTRVIRRV